MTPKFIQEDSVATAILHKFIDQIDLQALSMRKNALSFTTEGSPRIF